MSVELRQATDVIVNARIATGDPRRPFVDAVVVQDDRVLAMGSSAELRKLPLPGVTVRDAARGSGVITNGRVTFTPPLLYVLP